MSEQEKRIAEKVAAGLAEMPDAAGSMFLYGASCLKTGYELGMAAAAESKTETRKEEKESE